MAGRGLDSLPGRPRPFRVRAVDGADLQVASAYLQDAIVPVSEMAYERRNRRFVLVAQRLRRELLAGPEDPGGGRVLERVHCGIRVASVRQVASQGLNRGERGRMLNLLTIGAGGDAADFIDFAFSGDVTIRLSVERIDCQFEDIGEPWPSFARPDHALDPPDGAAEAGGTG